MTDEQIIVIYCFCDDFLKEINYQDWPNTKMSLAEIMLVYIVAARFFYGNIERSRIYLYSYEYIQKGLSKGQLNRRLHQVPDRYWHELIRYAYSRRNTEFSKQFIVDSFPISVCRNIRINRCKIYSNEEFRGYNASKREYFYGLKVNMIATADGQPFEVLLSPGSYHDLDPFKLMKLDLPIGSSLYADSAYTDYEYEEKIKQQGTKVVVERKENYSRPHFFEDWKNLKYFRRKIETTFGLISAWLPKKIHAVNSTSFELKLMSFVAALAINFIIN